MLRCSFDRHKQSLRRKSPSTIVLLLAMGSSSLSTRKHFVITLILFACVYYLSPEPQIKRDTSSLWKQLHFIGGEQQQSNSVELSKSANAASDQEIIITRKNHQRSPESEHEREARYLEELAGADPSSQQRQQQDLDSNTENEDEEIFALSIPFLDIFNTIVFLAAVWAGGFVCSTLVGMPSLVGEIVVGFLLGPPLASFVPYPASLVLIGNIGLIGLILESGLDIDVAQLIETGRRAIITAVCGTALPLLCGLAISTWVFNTPFASAFAVGASFAPSSLGVAGNALSAGNVLNTPNGQMIVATSVVDDVLGLILLSILSVLVDDQASAIDYVIPFVSSFGFLLVLGYAGVTWMPRVIQNQILPLVRDEYRQLLAFLLMFLLLIGYMPLLYYSKASYLTGTFLCGLSFSQITSTHAKFVNDGRPLLNWLMRIFFAATIGFQIPITRFADPTVLWHGGVLLLCVCAKLPLGLLVPQFQKELPQDFPYNPHKRDVATTSLALTCRGEFNVIIASYAVGSGLFDADLYSAVVFAVLIACVVPPLILLRLIQYYNSKSKAFLEANHPIKRIGNDGYRPLYLAIQARTKIHWGLQERFQKALETAGLIIIDHRSWHTLPSVEAEAVDITEIFVQDTKVHIRVPDQTNESTAVVDNEEQKIEERCLGVQRLLVQCLESDKPGEYLVQVTQWEPYNVFDRKTDQTTPNRDQQYCFSQSADTEEDDDKVDDDKQEEDRDDGAPKDEAARLPGRHVEFAVPADDDQGSHNGDRPDRRRLQSGERPGHQRQRTLTEPHLAQLDLWDCDNIAQDLANRGFILSPCDHGYEVRGCDGDSNAHGGRHRRAATFDARLLLDSTGDAAVAGNGDTIKDRLGGYVRSKSNAEDEQQPRQHRRNSSRVSVRRLSSFFSLASGGESVEDEASARSFGRRRSSGGASRRDSLFSLSSHEIDDVL